MQALGIPCRSGTRCARTASRRGARVRCRCTKEAHAADSRAGPTRSVQSRRTFRKHADVPDCRPRPSRRECSPSWGLAPLFGRSRPEPGRRAPAHRRRHTRPSPPTERQTSPRGRGRRRYAASVGIHAHSGVRILERAARRSRRLRFAWLPAGESRPTRRLDVTGAIVRLLTPANKILPSGDEEAPDFAAALLCLRAESGHWQ